MTADFSARKKTKDLQKDLEASRAVIERLRVNLALAHLGRMMLKEEMAQRLKEIAELCEDVRRRALNFKSLKEA